MSVMPQLDFVTYPSQLLWFFISFSCAYLVVRRFVVPGIEEIIRARCVRSQSFVDSALLSCALSGDLIERRNNRLSSAKLEAGAIITAAETEVEAMMKSAKGVISAELEEVFLLSNERLADLSHQYKEDFLSVTKILATLYCEKLVGKDRIAANKVPQIVDLLFEESC